MSFATCNGTDVRDGRITFRLRGAWDAELSVATDDATLVSDNIEIAIGGSLLIGHAVGAPEADEGNSLKLRVVGGYGGLDDAIEPLDYLNTSVTAVLSSILSVGSEVSSVTSDTALMARQMPRWTRMRGDVGSAVRALATHLGVPWRVLGTGDVWLGTDAWAAVTVAYTVESEDLPNRTIRAALETLGILPGMTFEGELVSEVVYTLDGARLRADVSFGDNRGELAELVGGMVARETAGAAYEKPYAAKALAQNADGTLELRPYSPVPPPASKVPVRLGVPGVSAYQITPGIDVVFEYEDGSPTKPIVTGFPVGAALKLSVDAPDIRLGSDNATDFVALASKVLTELQSIQAGLSTHTHPYVNVAASATTSAPLVPPYTAASVAATKVKAE